MLGLVGYRELGDSPIHHRDPGADLGFIKGGGANSRY